MVGGYEKNFAGEDHELQEQRTTTASVVGSTNTEVEPSAQKTTPGSKTPKKVKPRERTRVQMEHPLFQHPKSLKSDCQCSERYCSGELCVRLLHS
jgi:hypothetical protein